MASKIVTQTLLLNLLSHCRDDKYPTELRVFDLHPCWEVFIADAPASCRVKWKPIVSALRKLATLNLLQKANDCCYILKTLGLEASNSEIESLFINGVLPYDENDEKSYSIVATSNIIVPMGFNSLLNSVQFLKAKPVLSYLYKGVSYQSWLLMPSHSQLAQKIFVQHIENEPTHLLMFFSSHELLDHPEVCCILLDVFGVEMLSSYSKNNHNEPNLKMLTQTKSLDRLKSLLFEIKLSAIKMNMTEWHYIHKHYDELVNLLLSPEAEQADLNHSAGSKKRDLPHHPNQHQFDDTRAESKKANKNSKSSLAISRHSKFHSTC